MIERKTLVEMFDRMRQQGLDMDQPLLWSYFFTDRNLGKLEAAIPELERAAYGIVEVFQAETDGDAEPFYFLRVDKTEVHTVDTLHSRNIELGAFAARHGLDSYDGMEVGRVQGPPFEK